MSTYVYATTCTEAGAIIGIFDGTEHVIEAGYESVEEFLVSKFGMSDYGSDLITSHQFLRVGDEVLLVGEVVWENNHLVTGNIKSLYSKE